MQYTFLLLILFFTVTLVQAQEKVISARSEVIRLDLRNVEEKGPDPLATNLPRKQAAKPYARAVVIGNSNYAREDLKIPHAQDDAKLVKRYLIESLGYAERNIDEVFDAGKDDFERLFGNSDSHFGKLYTEANRKPNQIDLFVYIQGHAGPDINNLQAYFLTEGSNPETPSLGGYKIETFYNNLSKIPFKSLTVVIDACFSGKTHAGPIFKNGLAVPTPKSPSNPLLGKSNVVYITAAGKDQIASWNEKTRHSLLTECFLKGIQGDANKNGGALTLGELRTYLELKVPDMAYQLTKRQQNPEISGPSPFVLIRQY